MNVQGNRTAHLADVDFFKPDGVLNQICEETRAVFDFAAVSVRLIRDDDTVRIACSASGNGAVFFGPSSIPLQTRLTSKMLGESRPLSIKRIRSDPRVREQHRKLLVKNGYRSFLGSALRVMGRPMGTINCYTNIERVFEPRELALFGTLAAHAALVIENSRLSGEVREKVAKLKKHAIAEGPRVEYEDIHNLLYGLRTELHVIMGETELLLDNKRNHSIALRGDLKIIGDCVHALYERVSDIPNVYSQLKDKLVADERTRLARELHDGLAQECGVLSVRLVKLEANAASASVKEEIIAIRRLANALYEAVRRPIGRLMLSTEDITGAESLSSVLHDFSCQTGILVESKIDDEWMSRVSAHKAGQLIKIIREALINVRKHARAQHARMALEVDESTIRTAIADDGRGFDVAQERCGFKGLHFGLQSMRERTELIGGRLDVRSKPGHGTEVVVTVPLDMGGRN